MSEASRTILHVDDDPVVTRVISTRLEPLGYQLVELNDPRKAMELLIHYQFRVVLLDVDMPFRNGMDLLRDIKTHDGGIQVLMLTGIVNMSTVLQSFRWGAEACFFKPVKDIQPLAEALDQTFQKIDRWWKSLEEISRQKQVKAPV